ncbi:hypothetical protein H0H87_010521 [Tephrocybe sp. NHM501043]|nr:hypothetical protein H0H87_010521 [Tephrocybe sp. NHM501043]
MELDLDLDNSTLPSARSSPASTSPPHTPSNPALAQFAHTYGYPSAHTSPYASQPPSPGSAQPQVHFPHPAGAPPPLAHPEEVFNTYARFSADYSSHMPGTQFNPSGGDEIHVPNAPSPQPSQQQGIPPALLFAAAADQPAKLKLKVRGTQPASSPSPPATPSTASAHSSFPPPSAASPPGPSSVPPPLPPQSTASTPARTTPSHTPLPAAPSLLLSKPFRCPKPNCNKSYKQANGLKYHMTHGSCNFAPPKDLEHVKDLLERKRREREASAGLSRSASFSSLSPSNAPNGEPLASQLVNAHGEPLLHNLYGDLGCITETELREVEREAEKRVRPFACGVGDCQRRYKNMNGLRYHYQHSGDHGAVGLALLAGGLHECLGNNNNNAASTSASAADGGKVKPEPEREGRRRAAAAVRGMMHGAHAHTHMHGRGGAASTPVSRATSVVPSSRVGTPQPSCNASTTAGMMMQKSASAYAASGSASASASAWHLGKCNMDP